MHILGLLGMYFDAVVVKVEKSVLFQIGFGHTDLKNFIPVNFPPHLSQLSLTLVPA